MTKRLTKAELEQVELKKAQVISKKREIVEGLPHLYGFPWYPWAKDFYDSTNKMNILVAANQISKSSTQIRKNVNWATNLKLWPSLWRRAPKVFWYLYPNKDVSTIEFEKKWVPEFMPRGRFEKDPQYGWRAEYQGSPKKIYAVHWNSGVTNYFKHYSQDVQDLQTGTVDALFGDEELPEVLFDELMMRLAASDGYANFVFTATLNQEMWRKAFATGNDELFKDAFKQQVSMYDCLRYADGSPSIWTPERIRQIESRCKSQTEIQRRVHGQFVTEEGRKFPTFESTRHMIRPIPVPHDWKFYAACDIGSGGAQNHPAAIVFVAVRPDFRFGYVFKGWRGDGIETTSGDILDKYRELKAAIPVSQQIYDGAAKDFGTISVRQGEPFLKAEKSHVIGEDIVNTLFKNDMLFVFETDELKKLGSELSSLMKATPKNHAKDDFCDALRYCLVAIPWDWSALAGSLSEEELAQKYAKPLTEKELLEREIQERRGLVGGKEPEEGWAELVSEFNLWNDMAGS
jgi:hypothetical protein